MAWLYLIIAGIFEIGWPLGFKLSETTGKKSLWITMAIISMCFSGYFLWLAQKQISIGTAYAVWTGIGAAGTFIIGIIIFRERKYILLIQELYSEKKRTRRIFL